MNDLKRDVDVVAIQFKLVDGEMSFAEASEEILCKGYIHRTWIPSKPNNPSKIELHYWDGYKWNPTHAVRFVPSYEWGSVRETPDE